jgi:hypothetical protein
MILYAMNFLRRSGARATLNGGPLLFSAVADLPTLYWAPASRMMVGRPPTITPAAWSFLAPLTGGRRAGAAVLDLAYWRAVAWMAFGN